MTRTEVLSDEEFIEAVEAHMSALKDKPLLALYEVLLAAKGKGLQKMFHNFEDSLRIVKEQCEKRKLIQ